MDIEACRREIYYNWLDGTEELEKDPPFKLSVLYFSPGNAIFHYANVLGLDSIFVCGMDALDRIRVLRFDNYERL